MAIPRGTLTVVAPRRMDELPRELPDVPDELSARFPQVEEWQKQWDKWWFDFRTILQERDISDLLKATIADLASFKAVTTIRLDQLAAQQANLVVQVTILQTLVNNLNISSVISAITVLQILVGNLATDLTALTIRVNNNEATMNNFIALVNANSIPLIVLQNPSETPMFPPLVGKMGIFGTQRATNIVDGNWWTWNGNGWSTG